MENDNCIVCGSSRGTGPYLFNPEDSHGKPFWMCGKHAEAYTAIRKALGNEHALRFLVIELRRQADLLCKKADSIESHISLLDKSDHE